jgi:LacI family transcriptional regulator
VNEPASRIARNGFLSIADEMRARIDRGDWESGRYLPTERELQQLFEASRSTIRRSLSALVETGWAVAVPSKGVIARHPERMAPAVSMRQLAFIDAGSNALPLFYPYLSENARRAGFHLVHMANRLEVPVEEAVRVARDEGFAGAMIWSYRGFPDADKIGELARECPVVALDHPIRGLRCPLITYNYYQAGYDATRQLILQGRRRIAVSGMLDMLTTTHDRFSGYLSALFDHGLQPNVEDFIFNFTSGMLSPATRHVAIRLAAIDRPDGVLVLQDEFVPAVVQAAQRAQRAVPEDLAIASVGDDVEVFVGECGLTGVRLRWDLFAERSVFVLAGYLAGQVDANHVEIAPHQLVVRGLCGAPASSWTPGDTAPSALRGVSQTHYQFSPAPGATTQPETPPRRRGNQDHAQ